MKNLTRIITLISINVFLLTNAIQAQGNLEGYVYDTDGDKSPFANVQLMQDGFEQKTATDIDGFFSFENIPQGSYDLKVFAFGNEAIAKAVPVTNGKTENITIEMSRTIELEETIIVWHKSLFVPSEPTLKKYDAEFLETISTRELKDVVAINPSVTQSKEGELSFRGARPGVAVYYVDGMRTHGNLNIPLLAISSMEIQNGAVSARYGDTTGGVIIIETKSYFDDAF